MALVCILREYSFSRQGVIDFNFLCFREAIHKVFEIKKCANEIYEEEEEDDEDINDDGDDGEDDNNDSDDNGHDDIDHDNDIAIAIDNDEDHMSEIRDNFNDQKRRQYIISNRVNDYK